MVRKPGVEFPGALYHVIATSNRRTTPPFITTQILPHISNALNATHGGIGSGAMRAS